MIFEKRRKKLLDIIGEGTIILFGAEEIARNSDVMYKFRQNSDFYYFTGFTEPDSIAILRRKGRKDDYALFVQPNDPVLETWIGKREGLKGAITNYRANQSYDIKDFLKILPKYLDTGKVFLKSVDIEDPIKKEKIFKNKKYAKLDTKINNLRLIKSKEEIALLRKASRISMLGHLKAMSKVNVGIREYEIEALVDYIFRKNGATGTSFNTIVASGKNALCLHYMTNQSTLLDGDLLLIDAGAEYKMYAGDISTTFPINGKFTEAQRNLYEIILMAQRECIESIKPGITFAEIAEISKSTIENAVISKGIITLSQKKFSKISMKYLLHSPNHFIGLDLHDVGNGKRKLRKNMTFTIEPGIYIPNDDELFPIEFRGMGIRLEDDILVTKNGREILGEDNNFKLPRTPNQIEQFMKTKTL